jgi:hypothetical protein
MIGGGFALIGGGAIDHLIEAGGELVERIETGKIGKNLDDAGRKLARTAIECKNLIALGHEPSGDFVSDIPATGDQHPSHVVPSLSRKSAEAPLRL